MKQLVWAILLAFPVGVLADEIYRTVDADGRVIFTDRPGDGQNVELVEIDVAPPPTVAAGDEDGSADEDEEDDNSPFGAEVPRPSTDEEIAAQRSENCDYAQQVAETYTIARRLYRDLGDGEREYLSDDEIDQARSQAEENVAIWCD